MDADAVELRYSAGAKLRDVLVCFALAMVLGSCLIPVLRVFMGRDVEALLLVAVWTGICAPAVLVAGLWRWGRRGRVDADGVSYAGSARGPVRQLAWADVDEVFDLGPGGVVLRGGEAAIRLSADFDGVGAVGVLVGSRRGAALGAELERRFREGETIRFRGPMETKEAAAGGALLAFFFLPAILVPLGYAAFRMSSAWSPMPGPAATAGGIGVFMTVLLGAFLAARARACGWVEIGPGGLRSRSAWRVRGCRWDEMAGVERDRSGRIAVRLKTGASIRIAPGLGNFAHLQRLLELGRERGAAS